MAEPMIRMEGLSRSFRLANQRGAAIPVMRGAALDSGRGERVTLAGPFGPGKSTPMRMIRGGCLADTGRVLVAGLDVATAAPREILALCRGTLGHVRQFLRVVARLPAREAVAEPPPQNGRTREGALARAEALPARLDIPGTLRGLSRTTFPGGGRPRVNIARGFADPSPAPLLDEPAASLDAAAPARVCDREADLSRFAPVADSVPA